MARSRKRARNSANLKLWTILCLIVVCIAAIALRGVIVYKLYPLDYREEIERLSGEYSIDKYFVCAVICAESHFDENAVSHQGAVGLMQVMPATGEWAAGHIGLDDYSEEKLKVPEINITIGCWYLSYLNELFNRDARKVLAAYNAGPAKVQDWLDGGDELGDIPYNETESYLKKVQFYYEIYKGLYKDF